MNNYDICVIGAGPAGLMAAGRAAELGAKVVLLEKNTRPGIKLLTTGGGRCNITNNISEIKKIIEDIGTNGKFLYNAFSAFSNFDVIDFFHSYGVKTKTEKITKIFPEGDDAKEILDVLVKYVNKGHVDIIKNCTVKYFVHNDVTIDHLSVPGGTVQADNYIIATGGMSYPETGSTGDAYKWAKDLGHTVHQPIPALMPVMSSDSWVSAMQGVSLSDVDISVVCKNKKVISLLGDVMFTHYGLSGPAIFDLSKQIEICLKDGVTQIYIDMFSGKDHKTFDNYLLDLISDNPNKSLKNLLEIFLPQKMVRVVVKNLSLQADKKASVISKNERKSIINMIKPMKINVSKTGGFSRAIITSGGISTKEIDPKTMRSKIYNNLYFAGEVIDIDGPTGGYNLQIAWSTGRLAGSSAVSS